MLYEVITDQDDLRMLEVGNGVGHGSRTERGGKTCHRGSVSKPGAMVDVVRPEAGPRELLERNNFV